MASILRSHRSLVSPLRKTWIGPSKSTPNTWSTVARTSQSPPQTLLLAHHNHHAARHGSLLRFGCRRWNSSSSGNGGGANAQQPSFLQRFLAPKPMPPRNTPKWYAEMALLCTVFGITGSSTMFLVRPAVSEGLGLRGSMKEGPWSFRICSLVVMTPLYATLLVVVGTLFGRHAYFRHFSVKMFSRFGVPTELMDRNFRANAKNFRKW